MNNNGSIILENSKPQNVTFVDGLQVSKKNITTDSRIELGNDRHKLDLQAIMKLLLPIIEEEKRKNPQTHSIQHLQQVWDQYHDALLQHQIKNGKQAALQGITGILSPIALILTFVPIEGMEPFRPVLYAVMAVLGAIFCWLRYKSSTSNPLYLDELNKQFRKEYVCPNCQVFIGNQSFEDFKKIGRCGYCRSILKDG